jgi:hypothetical protein
MSLQEMSTDFFTTLSECKDWLEKETRTNMNSALCPCCDRFDNVYNYPIPCSSVSDLANLCRSSAAQPDVSVRHVDFTANSGAVAKLKHVSLIYQPEKDNKSGGKTGGTWAITPKGIDFVQGIISIPTHLILYHNELLGVSETRKFIGEFWPDFNYQEMMTT